MKTGTKRSANTKRPNGVFITFEGIEGSGKTTQLARLAKSLREERYHVLETREPGSTPLAERIRGLLLDVSSAPPSPELMTSECEAALILAARSQHVAQVITPALQEGMIVLCDRFSDSTSAYQGYGRRLGLAELRRVNRVVTHGLSPNLTLLFDLPVPSGLARRRRERAVQNRLDQETRRFHERVRRGFLDLAGRHPRRIHVIDARPDPDIVADQVAEIVKTYLGKQKRFFRDRDQSPPAYLKRPPARPQMARTPRRTPL